MFFDVLTHLGTLRPNELEYLAEKIVERLSQPALNRLSLILSKEQRKRADESRRSHPSV